MSSITDPGSGAVSAGGVRRRTVIGALPVAVASAAVLGVDGCTSPASPARTLHFFTAEQAAVVEAATARIAPGPADDPAEAGHPGAREADVTGYIDSMLAQLAALDEAGSPPPLIFAGGPWSNRHTSGPDLMARFMALDPVARIAWRKRLQGWQEQYRTGIASLDKLAGGDFAKASHARQDKILASSPASTFMALLYEHTIEGLYSAPEYGGNRGLAGWKDIAFPGDIQPRGYTPDEVTRSDGHDPVDNTGVVADVLKLLGSLG
ncbi:MAG: gluconate 2-dehydrogenase subunit 3 family protein [Streptosporangiaceae bacterium]